MSLLSVSKALGVYQKYHTSVISRVLHKQDMNTCIVDKTAQCSLCNLQTEVFRGPTLRTLYLVDISTYTHKLLA